MWIYTCFPIKQSEAEGVSSSAHTHAHAHVHAHTHTLARHALMAAFVLWLCFSLARVVRTLPFLVPVPALASTCIFVCASSRLLVSKQKQKFSKYHLLGNMCLGKLVFVCASSCVCEHTDNPRVRLCPHVLPAPPTPARPSTPRCAT